MSNRKNYNQKAGSGASTALRRLGTRASLRPSAILKVTRPRSVYSIILPQQSIHRPKNLLASTATSGKFNPYLKKTMPEYKSHQTQPYHSDALDLATETIHLNSTLSRMDKLNFDFKPLKPYTTNTISGTGINLEITLKLVILETLTGIYIYRPPPIIRYLLRKGQTYVSSKDKKQQAIIDKILKKRKNFDDFVKNTGLVKWGGTERTASDFVLGPGWYTKHEGQDNLKHAIAETIISVAIIIFLKFIRDKLLETVTDSTFQNLLDTLRSIFKVSPEDLNELQEIKDHKNFTTLFFNMPEKSSTSNLAQLLSQPKVKAEIEKVFEDEYFDNLDSELKEQFLEILVQIADSHEEMQPFQESVAGKQKKKSKRRSRNKSKRRSRNKSKRRSRNKSKRRYRNKSKRRSRKKPKSY